jgi:hypothetical protein
VVGTSSPVACDMLLLSSLIQVLVDPDGCLNGVGGSSRLDPGGNWHKKV